MLQEGFEPSADMDKDRHGTRNQDWRADASQMTYMIWYTIPIKVQFAIAFVLYLQPAQHSVVLLQLVTGFLPPAQ
jgi:hypothetical protein